MSSAKALKNNEVKILWRLVAVGNGWLWLTPCKRMKLRRSDWAQLGDSTQGRHEPRRGSVMVKTVDATTTDRLRRSPLYFDLSPSCARKRACMELTTICRLQRLLNPTFRLFQCFRYFASAPNDWYSMWYYNYGRTWSITSLLGWFFAEGEWFLFLVTPLDYQRLGHEKSVEVHPLRTSTPTKPCNSVILVIFFSTVRAPCNCYSSHFLSRLCLSIL